MRSKVEDVAAKFRMNNLEGAHGSLFWDKCPRARRPLPQSTKYSDWAGTPSLKRQICSLPTLSLLNIFSISRYLLNLHVLSTKIQSSKHVIRAFYLGEQLRRFNPTTWSIHVIEAAGLTFGHTGRREGFLRWFHRFAEFAGSTTSVL